MGQLPVAQEDVPVAREYGVPVPEYVGPERVAEDATADHRVVSTDADAVGDLPRRDDPAAAGAGRRVGLRDGVRGDAPLVGVNDALVLRLTIHGLVDLVTEDVGAHGRRNLCQLVERIYREDRANRI